MKKKKSLYKKVIPVSISLPAGDYNKLKKFAKKSKLSISTIVEAFIVMAILKEKCPKEMSHVS